MTEFGLPQEGFVHVPVDNGNVKVHVWNSRTFWSTKNKEKGTTENKEKDKKLDK